MTLAPAEEVAARIESPIVLADLWPSRLHPVRLAGSYGPDGLCFIRAPDMGLEWSRYPGEEGAHFSRRVANDIRIARGAPPVSESEPEAEEAPAVANSRPRAGLGSKGPRHNAQRVRVG